MKIEDILLNEKEVMSLQDMRSTSLGAIGHDKIVAATQLRKALIMLDNGRLLSLLLAGTWGKRKERR